MGGFKKFLLRGNLVELAVAVVIALAFAAVVTALVADLITPLIAAIGGKPDFSGLSFTVNHSKFLYGASINALISFVIIAAVIYFFVVIPVGKRLAMSEKEQEATERECPECLSQIPLAARRCMYCTRRSPRRRALRTRKPAPAIAGSCCLCLPGA
jgi:large conductance mechanosensitive channel